MGDKLEIYTLGNLSIRLNDTAVSGFASRKAEALLVYLACNPRPHARETLATMFWDDAPQKRALANLSVLLTSLRKSVGPFLNISRHEIAISSDESIWVDALDLSNTLRQSTTSAPLTRSSAANFARVIGTVHGPFLSGFYIQQAGAFSEWALLEQERLQQLAIAGMDRLVAFYAERGQFSEGSTLCLKLVSFDPLREASHRQLMRLYAQNGQRNAALEQYQLCKAVLEEELGVEPSKKTRALLAQIRDSEEETVQPVQRRPFPPGARFGHNLLTDITPFIGREAELAKIEERLNQPACRLLTVIGPGGVGKTRLLQTAARQRVDQYLDGVWLVSLAPLGSADLLETALADAIGFTFSGRSDTRTQLLGYLSRKEMLLVFDNFEHILGESSISFLSAVLTRAPEIQLLVSSRERLNVRAEWLLEVHGLPCPPETVQDSHEQYGAVQLFLQRAQQLAPTFENSLRTRREVADIVRLLDGMPLGIELAASHIRYHSCAEIAAGIRQGLDFLKTTLRDLPERHRSLRAVIDRSWDSLTADEQNAFMMLSVFRGAFSQGAAQALLKSHVNQLYILVDKSLLQRLENGRFQLHNLLQQYAAERLAADVTATGQARRRHVRYYATLLQQWQDAIKGGDQSSAISAVQNDIENIRAGWQYVQSLESSNSDLLPLLNNALDTLFYYYSMGSWFQEGKSVFERGAALLADASSTASLRLRAGLLARYGWFAFLLGEKEAGRAALEQSLAISERLNERRELIFCHNYLGAVAYYEHDFEHAKTHLHEAIRLARQEGDVYGEAIGLNILGVLHFDLKKLDVAEAHLRDSLRLKRRVGDRWGTAFSLEKLGTLEMASGDRSKAENRFEESLAIRRELGDRRGVALCLYQLAELAQQRGDAETGASLYGESLALFETIGDVQAIDAVQKKLKGKIDHT